MRKKSWQLTKKELASLEKQIKDGPSGRYGRTPASTKDAEEMRERREEQRLAQEKLKRVQSM